MNASRQGLSRGKGFYKNTRLGAVVFKVSGQTTKSWSPTGSTVTNQDGLHKSFRCRISQAIRFRKYGMCCCGERDSLSSTPVLLTRPASPHSSLLQGILPTSSQMCFEFSSHPLLMTCGFFLSTTFPPTTISIATALAVTLGMARSPQAVLRCLQSFGEWR